MNTFKIYLAIITAIGSWSSAFVFIRIALRDYPPGELALFRYVIVSVVMLIFYIKLKKHYRPTLRELILIFLFGAVGIGLYTLLLNYGEQTISASIASFIIGITPVVTMILAWFFLKEDITRRQWFGVGVGMLGLLIIAGNKLLDQTLDFGLLYIGMATIAAAIYNIGQKPFLKKFHPIEVAAMSAWAGLIVMLPYTAATLEIIPHASWQATGACIYIGVIPGAIGYLAWSYLLSSEIPTTKVAATLYFLPLFSTLFGWLLINEIPTLTALIGGCVAVAGAFIAKK